MSKKPSNLLIIKVIMGVFLIGLVACQSSSQTSFSPTAVTKPGNGKLYVYWPGQRWGEKSGKSPEILLAGESLGLLKYKGFIERELPEGTYELKLSGEGDVSDWDGAERSFPAKIEAGENLFVRLLVKYDQESNRLLEGRMKYAVTFLPRGEKEAKPEMAGLKPLDQ